MVTIILAHPWHGSFNKAIMDVIMEKYESEAKPYQIIDLNKDRFNPVVSEDELALYNEGGVIDPMVFQYQDMIKNTDEVIFIFPNWWSSMPAILHGFFDKVFSKGFAFTEENGWTPLLDVQKTTVITTSAAPTSVFADFVENVFIAKMLSGIGFKNAKWYNCERVVAGGEQHRKDFLSIIESAV